MGDCPRPASSRSGAHSEIAGTVVSAAYLSTIRITLVCPQLCHPQFKLYVIGMGIQTAGLPFLVAYLHAYWSESQNLRPFSHISCVYVEVQLI